MAGSNPEPRIELSQVQPGGPMGPGVTTLGAMLIFIISLPLPESVMERLHTFYVRCLENDRLENTFPTFEDAKRHIQGCLKNILIDEYRKKKPILLDPTEQKNMVAEKPHTSHAGEFVRELERRIYKRGAEGPKLALEYYVEKISRKDSDSKSTKLAAEFCREMGISQAAFYVRLARSRMLLAKIMEEMIEEGWD